MPPVTDAHGQLVGGRYRLVGRVGIGSVGRVFLAEDTRLRRRVAIKRLDPSLAGDPAVRDRFASEVQIASNLKHPHIVVIHDWSAAEDAYLVTEFLDEGSLATMLDRGCTLSPSQAVTVGIAVGRALAYAHARGSVHRKLCPSDVLFGDHGRARIGDFGMARVLATASMTDTLGALDLGARYAAPEVLTGESAQGAADVYSLALLLVEAVTGEVPGSGGDLAALLESRTSRPIEVPEELGALATVVVAAGHPEARRRLDATGLVTALMTVARSLPAPEPLPLVPHDVERLDGASPVPSAGATTPVGAGPGDGVDPDDRSLPDITLVGAVALARAAEEGRVAARSQSVGSTPGVSESTGEPRDEPPPVPDAPRRPSGPTTDDRTGSTGGPVEPGVRVGAGRRRVVIGIVVALVLALGGSGVWYAITQRDRTPTHPIPDVTGSSVTQAKGQLEALGFVVELTRDRRDGSRAGDLLEVRPAPGTIRSEGTTVTLVVSDGPTLVTLPDDLAGVTAADATRRIEELGLSPGDPEHRYSEDVDQGAVVGFVDKTPDRLEKGATVTLVVSDGPEPRVVPDVSGMTPDQAIEALRGLRLEPVRAEDYSFDVDTGGLIGLDPGVGTKVPRGAQVKVIVSKGLLVEVPELGGVVSVSGAIAKLEAAGLHAGTAKGSGSLSGRPVGFSPASGTAVAKGSTVDIVVE